MSRGLNSRWSYTGLSRRTPEIVLHGPVAPYSVIDAYTSPGLSTGSKAPTEPGLVLRAGQEVLDEDVCVADQPAHHLSPA